MRGLRSQKPVLRPPLLLWLGRGEEAGEEAPRSSLAHLTPTQEGGGEPGVGEGSCVWPLASVFVSVSRCVREGVHGPVCMRMCVCMCVSVCPLARVCVNVSIEQGVPECVSVGQCVSVFALQCGSVPGRAGMQTPGVNPETRSFQGPPYPAPSPLSPATLASSQGPGALQPWGFSCRSPATLPTDSSQLTPSKSAEGGHPI